MSDDPNSPVSSLRAMREHLDRRLDVTDAKIDRVAASMTVVEKGVNSLRCDLIGKEENGLARVSERSPA